jgi:hypothetical protein
VKAVLLLFPCAGKLSEIRKAEEKKEGSILPCEVGETETLWIPQTVSLSFNCAKSRKKSGERVAVIFD